MDKLVWEMRQAKSGLEMKIQKTFFSSIPNACTGEATAVSGFMYID